MAQTTAPTESRGDGVKVADGDAACSTTTPLPCCPGLRPHKKQARGPAAGTSECVLSRLLPELFATLAPFLGLAGHRRLLSAVARNAALRRGPLLSSALVADVAAREGGLSCLAYFEAATRDAAWARATTTTTTTTTAPACSDFASFRRATKHLVGPKSPARAGVPEALRDDAQLHWQAVNASWQRFRFVPTTLPKAARTELAVLAAEQHPTRVLVEHPDLRRCRRVVAAAAAVEPSALRFADDALREDKRLVDALVARRPEAFAYAGPNFKRDWLRARCSSRSPLLRLSDDHTNLRSRMPRCSSSSSSSSSSSMVSSSSPSSNAVPPRSSSGDRVAASSREHHHHHSGSGPPPKLMKTALSSSSSSSCPRGFFASCAFAPQPQQKLITVTTTRRPGAGSVVEQVC